MSSTFQTLINVLNPVTTPVGGVADGITGAVTPSSSSSSPTGGSSSTPSTGSATSAPTSGGSASTPSGGVATSTPTSPPPIADTTDTRALALVVGQTVYVNMYASFSGINPWKAYTVGWVFSDGNAVLVSEPNMSLYTGGLVVGVNMRRADQTYANPAPGP